MFYPRHQMPFRISLFYYAVPLSGAFSGLLATGLSKIEVRGYRGVLASILSFWTIHTDPYIG